MALNLCKNVIFTVVFEEGKIIMPIVIFAGDFFTSLVTILQMEKQTDFKTK